MKLITERLINKVETINNYLADKVEQEPSYHHFIQKLKSVITELKQTKLKVKFVSRSATLAEQLKQISQQQITDRAFYQFHTASYQTKIDKILENCDLLYLVRDSQLSISNADKRLIRRANKANICQAILNVERIENDNSIIRENNVNCIHTWLTEQEYHHIELFFLSLNHESNSNSLGQINDYYYFLERLLLDSKVKTEARITKEIITKVNQLFNKQKQLVWQQVKQGKQALEQQHQEHSQRKTSLLLPKNKRQQQNIFKELRQKINQKKIDIVNPFIPQSLIYKVQQLVNQSEVTIIEEKQEKYLYLVIKQKDYSQRLITKVINLCQEELTQWVEEEWKAINSFYVESSVDNYRDINQTELESANESPGISEPFSLTVTPSFELTNFVSLSVLEESSKTHFDYHFFESSRFRLVVAMTFGLVLFSLTGRLFSFIFLIFQVINLLTGKDVKTMKLKQQTKELKRNLDSKYQSLVRFLTDRALHIIVSALEEENQKYQEHLDNLIKENEEKLTQLKQTISQDQERLNNLKQDEIEILSLI